MKYCYLLLSLFSASFLSAQKHDYNWALGLHPAFSAYRFYFNFSTDPPSEVIRQDTFSTLYTSSYSDSSGQILFFSNNLTIFNRYGEVVEGATGLNPSIPWYQGGLSYPTDRMSFFLQKPGDPNIVYYISLDGGIHPDSPSDFVGVNVMVATLDVNANNGHGKALSVNVPLLSGRFVASAAVKHANGRDWWILTSHADSNLHYRVLLSDKGFSIPEVQAIGSKPNPLSVLHGDNFLRGNRFSETGRYYLDINAFLGFSLFEFDRCTGLLSNERRVNFPPPDVFTGGVRYVPGSSGVFSPNDSFLYVPVTLRQFPSILIPGERPMVFQYDLTAVDLVDQLDTIFYLDPLVYGINDVTGSEIGGAQLGPDGRIYFGHLDTFYASVQYPDKRGKACNFRYKNPRFGTFKFFGIPYYPNYRLGPLDGSGCDTLGLNNIPQAHFRVEDTLNSLTRFFYDLSTYEPASWWWTFGDGGTSTARYPVHAYSAPGWYEVCLTVSNANGSTTWCRTIWVGTVGVSSVGGPLALHIAPNPASDYVWLRGPEGSMLQHLVVLDVTGRTVYEASSGGVGEWKIPVVFWPAGTYYVVGLLAGGKGVVGKVVVGR